VAARLVEVGTDFQASSLAVLARARVSHEDVPSFLQRLVERGIGEIALLSTCNRFELYAAADDLEEATAVLEAEVGTLLGGNGHAETVVRHEGDAVGHLVAVAAGLESALLGEHEILGQVRRAHIRAVEAGTAGEALGRLFTHAMRHGRRIRRALGISKLRRSLTDLAAEWVAAQLPDPSRRSAVLVGAGETAWQMASRLRSAGIGRLTVVNRSVERSRELAETLDAHTGRLEHLSALLPHTDLLVLATSAPEPLVKEADVLARSSPLVLVDLGLSPNADSAIARHPAVKTLTLSDVIDLALGSNGERARPLQADALVQEAVDEFIALAKSRAASTV
jgi:glutamyl-tRNA reductase